MDAFRAWRVYLQGSTHQVLVKTDHKNLIYFTTTKELNRRQTRWAETLANYNFRISYVKGSENARADALSRKPEYQSNQTHESFAIFKQETDSLVFNKRELATTSRAEMDPFIEQIKQAYDRDPVAHAQRQALWKGFDRNRQGLLLFSGRIYVPIRTRTKFVELFHELPAHGHAGIAKTLARMARDYYFPGMRAEVKKVVLKCDTCIRNKAARHAPYGFLQSATTPSQPWKSIALDFVVKLPLSKDPWTKIEYDSILVIMDRLTKYAYYVPYKESSTATDLAQVFLQVIVANHGVPMEIISDRDKLFTSKFWTSLTALLGIKRKLSTAFHPQSDPVERVNQIMEAYLRCYINYRQNNWVELLPLAQFAYNTADSETTSVSPYFANHGFNPAAYHSALDHSSTSQEANVKADMLKTLHQELAEDIRFISQKSSLYYNRKRSMGPTLKKGDKVYLVRRNIRTKRPSDKLDHRKLGPFEIDEVIGPVNYKLKLPKTMNIHNVFHVSLLEKAPPGAPPAPKTEIQPVNPEAEYEVEDILDCRYFGSQIKYLIKWLGYPRSEDTWEPLGNLNCPEKLAEFHQRNPDLPKQDRKDRRTEKSRRKIRAVQRR